jgi:hypothetical protein
MAIFPDLIPNVPFVWTTICCIAVYAFGLPLYANNVTSTTVQVVVACVWGVLALVVSLGTLLYLYRAFVEPRKFFHPNSGQVINLLFFLDVWFSLLTVQAAVLYVPYMFDPAGAFLELGTSATPGGVVGGAPWYVFLEIFVTAANNFHGASNVGVDAVSAVAMIWMTVCSIIARMFTWFAVAILIRFTWVAVDKPFSNNNNNKVKRYV